MAALRDEGSPTVPSTIGEEKATNPFMRCDSEEIIAHVTNALAGDRSPAAVVGAVRAAKDKF
jgi:hydroxyacylglutathione hydrolase